MYTLPLIYWSGESLSKISRFIGKPICANDYVSKQTRLIYARFLVEVDIAKTIGNQVYVIMERVVSLNRQLRLNGDHCITSNVRRLVMNVSFKELSLVKSGYVNRLWY